MPYTEACERRPVPSAEQAVAPAIEATGLTKSYGTHHALKGVGLSVPRGTVFALLGPNGAGKTTAVRILATLTTADAGTARVGGPDGVAARPKVRPHNHRPAQDAPVADRHTRAE
ncbi:ATP-binding cassette domain-containing protein, partial [Streptomyces sp. NPDC054863]